MKIDWATVGCGAVGLIALFISSPAATVIFIVLALLAWVLAKYIWHLEQ